MVLDGAEGEIVLMHACISLCLSLSLSLTHTQTHIHYFACA